MSLKVFVCALAFLSLASCVPPEPDDDLMRTFDPETTVMGRVQEAGLLRVGVPNDRPTLADAESGDGFVASLGAEVADSLGIRMELVTAPNDSLIGLIDSGELDLVFPAVSITEQRVRQNNDKHLFLDPYLVAHQRLLVRADPVSSSDVEPETLAGELVCSFIDPETELDISSIEPSIEVREAADPEECGTLMARGKVDAVTASDVVLLGLADIVCGLDCDGARAEIAGDEISTFGYGPVIEGGASSWKDYVVNVLEEAQQEGRWEEYYEKYLTGLSDGEVLEPPGMTVEEAAALFPKEL